MKDKIIEKIIELILKKKLIGTIKNVEIEHENIKIKCENIEIRKVDNNEN